MVAPSGLLPRLRAWRPSPTALRRAFLGALVMNTVIVVTGGAVRLTASGLGCPTVPKCTDTSMVVTREMGVHGYIEFGNRMLTFVLTAAVVAAVVTAWRARRRDLVQLSGALFLGIVVQAVLGAVTVRTGLNPVTVMAHFLLSMGLIAVAAYAHDLARGPRTATTLVVRREIRVGARLVVGVVAAVLFLGTVVTGTGPHSGDKNASHRLPFNLADVTHAHADLVFVLLGLTVGLHRGAARDGAPQRSYVRARTCCSASRWPRGWSVSRSTSPTCRWHLSRCTCSARPWCGSRRCGCCWPRRCASNLPGALACGQRRPLTRRFPSLTSRPSPTCRRHRRSLPSAPPPPPPLRRRPTTAAAVVRGRPVCHWGRSR